MKVLKMLNRVYLDRNKFERTIKFYGHLFNEECKMRFTHQKLGLELGQVGSVLLIAGTKDVLKPVKITQMTFLVDVITDFRDKLISEGAPSLKDQMRFQQALICVCNIQTGLLSNMLNIIK